MPRAALLLLAVLIVGCGDAPPPPPPVVARSTDPAKLESHITNFCGTACHSLSGPEVFPRKHWRMEVERGYRFFEVSGLPLDVPPIEDVIRYFEQRAPEELPPLKVVPASHPCPVRFEKVLYPAPTGPRPMVSNVRIVRLPDSLKAADAASAKPLLLASDMANGRLLRLTPSDAAPAWRVLADGVPNPAHAKVLDLDGDGLLDLLVAGLGSFPPTERRCGSVVWLRGQAGGTFAPPVTLLKDVGRVADVQAADFRGTGKKDLVVAVFGLNQVGEILVLDNKTTDWAKPVFEPRVIDNRHGAIHVPVADLNGDGKLDFVSVIAQEHETVVAYLGDGAGGFKAKTLYTAPHPGWGSSGIELVDLNGDGRLDVLYTNGDILDEPYLYKPYHGVQWLENQGDMKFVHRRMADMYGVHHAASGRVCGGKLPDVVAVSFLPADRFPDRASKRPDAVVLFEQTAPGKFERHPLAVGNCDAVVCAVGDLFGSGRADVVVGNFSAPDTTAPVTVYRNRGPAAGDVGRTRPPTGSGS